MQKMGTAPMRNQQMNPKVSVPEKSGSPSTGAAGMKQTGHAPGSSVQGFSTGGEKPAKVKC
jgi:hypothetical protein